MNHVPKLLMYHSLAKPGYKPSALLKRFVVETHHFEEQLAWLEDNGYTSMTLAAALQDKAVPEKTVILTFDDAFADFELAVPLLKKYGFSATLFVPTAFVGGRSGWLPGSDGQHLILSWRALRDLAKEGVDIAAHGHEHLQLDNVPLSVAQKDIERGKGMLEHYLGQAVTGFAYPYGYYTRAVKRFVQEAGFAGACAVDKRVFSEGDTFAMSRLTVAGGMTAAALGTLMARQDSVVREASTSAKAVLWRAARKLQPSLQFSFHRPSKRIESRQ